VSYARGSQDRWRRRYQPGTLGWRITLNQWRSFALPLHSLHRSG